MTELNKSKSSKGEKTLLMSLLLSAQGPIVTGIPALTSHSATQIADFLRRSAELAALFVSWWVYRKLLRSIETDAAFRAKLERIADLTVAGAMICSGIAMFVVGVARLFVYRASGNVVMGLIIAVLGALTNTWFWLRYARMARERFDSVIAGQQKLYRAKACVDLCVVTALASVVIAPGHPVTRYIDALGCIIVACYLLYNGFDMIVRTRAAGNPGGKDMSAET